MKIEEGCLAIVIASGNEVNIGKVVRVGKFIGEKEAIIEQNGYTIKIVTFAGSDNWETDVEMITNRNRKIFFQREKNLLRIDGNETLISEEKFDVLEPVK